MVNLTVQHELDAVQFELYNVQLARRRQPMRNEIVLFHSVLGLRPGVLDWAARWRAAGYSVHTPDLFEGQTFDSLDDGVKLRDSIGIPGLIQRAQAAVQGLPQSLVYAGFSMGAAPAQLLAMTRPGARGAILMHGAIDPAHIGVPTWPAGVAAQVHYAAEDPWVDAAEVRALESAVKAARAPIEIHTYPGKRHLFADPGLPDYEATSAAAMFERTLAFLAARG
jgi:dienelactone hydrolase